MTTTEITRHPAKDLTDEEWDARVSRAHELHEQIKSGVLAGRIAWWATASAIYEFHQLSGITVLYGTDTSIEAYCADPDLALTKQRFMEYRNAWRQVELSGLTLDDVKDVPYSNLVRMFKAINDGKVTFREALDESRSLSQSDIREKYDRKPKALGSGQPDPRRSDEPGPAEGMTAAGPDEGTGDEIGEPDAIMAKTEESPSGHDAPPTDADDGEHDAYIRGRVEALSGGEADLPDDLPLTPVVRSPVSAEDWQEAQDQPVTFSEPSAPAPQATEPESLRERALAVVEAYRSDSNPIKHVRKDLREAILALADVL